ncbi:MAG: hypothetical protein B6I38_02745 [Anaerolineaceae bacterium 4572_5.1]|nr:MAG: hypothetical protein B6I38_02745 [Anaerolineaceae bacterium 4572_5.1]
MSEKITVIEGPTPIFQEVRGLWNYGLLESHLQHDTILTELRAFDGFALVERCQQAWSNQEPISLEYRTEEGLPAQLPIVAAYCDETDEGDVIQLWLRLERDDIEIELEYDDKYDDEYDDEYDDDDDFDPLL